MFNDVYGIIITAHPEAIVTALNEIKKQDSKAKGKQLSPEVQFVDISKSYSDIITGLKNTIFIQHIFPVQIIVPISDSNLIQKLYDLCRQMPSDYEYSIQIRDAMKEIETIDKIKIINEIQQKMYSIGYKTNDKYPVWVLSMYIQRGEVYAGVSYCTDNLSNWNGGIHRFKKDDQFVSRAEFKLLEAVDKFQIDMVNLTQFHTIKKLKAIDLGAAPGGWTKLLLNYGFHVTAVDPAELSKKIINHPNLLHIRDVVQNFHSKKGIFNFLVNDMRMDTIESCKIMLQMAQYLSQGATALMTLKLSHGQWYKKTMHALAILQNKYELLGVRQLFNNRSEVMVYLKVLDKVSQTRIISINDSSF